jgi:hypothetical protein
MDALNDGPWGDIVCGECHAVLGTMCADEPGIYTIVRQDRLSAAVARAEAAEAEAARLREVLEMVETVADESMEWCPWCRAETELCVGGKVVHAPDCPRQAALGEERLTERSK